MKRHAIPALLLSALLTLSALAGCSGRQPASAAPTPGPTPLPIGQDAAGPTAAPVSGSAAPAAGAETQPAWPVPENSIGFAPIENFAPAGVVRAVRDTPRGAASDKGYYEVIPRADGSALLGFVDFAAKQHIVLCSQPNCTHDSESCPAWYASDNALRVFPVGDRVAVLQGGAYSSGDGAGQDAVPRVDTMDADGSGRQTVFTFPASCWVSTMPHYHMARDDENLYFVVVDSAAGDRQAILCAAHIPSGQVFALCGLPEDETHLIGGTDGALLLEYTPGINQSGNAAPADTRAALLDLASLQLTQVAGYPFGSALTACDGGTLYLLGDDTVRSISLADGSVSEAAVTLPEGCSGIQQVCGVFDGQLAAYTWTDGSAEASGELCFFAIDPATGTRTDLPYRFSGPDGRAMPCQPLAESGDAILCQAGQDSSLRFSYALVPKADFWAGTADMTPLPTPAA